MVVPGFPAERVYMHRRHPVLCVDASDPSCKPDAYVIAGDHVLAGADCAGWTRIEFKGRKETIGWVATARLPDHGPLAPTDLASPTALVLARSPSRHPESLEAARLLNDRREHGRPRGRFVLPSALQNTTDLKVFPKGVGSEYHREDNEVSDALLQGHTLKAVTYSVGGTCFDNYLELWDPTFSRRLSVAGSNRDNEVHDGYTSEELVDLQDGPYFAHITRGERTVTLSSFDAHLRSRPVCEVSEVALAPERVKSAVDGALCAAVLSGRISGAPVADVERHSLSPESFGFSEASQRFNVATVTARGRLDVDNDGQSEEVVLISAEYGASSAGCGHDVETTVPIKVAADGTPEAGSAFNLAMVRAAVAGEDTRLFNYHGKNYLETRSRADVDGDRTHGVYELSGAGRRLMCKFQSVHYEAFE